MNLRSFVFIGLVWWGLLGVVEGDNDPICLPATGAVVTGGQLLFVFLLSKFIKSDIVISLRACVVAIVLPVSP